MVFLDLPLRYQLEQLRDSTIALGQQWHKDIGPFGSNQAWPRILQKNKLLSALDMGDFEDQDDELDFEALGLPLTDTLELDEQHAQFLESKKREEEDEVERLVGLLESTGNSDRIREAASSLADIPTVEALGDGNFE